MVAAERQGTASSRTPGACSPTRTSNGSSSIVRSRCSAWLVAGWLRPGDVESVQTVTDGIDHAVEAFLGMLRGGNVGKALVRLDTSWTI